jgi:pyruvate kinase
MKFSRRRAKIVATIGPASNSPEMLREMLAKGMDVARFNFSHGGPAEQAPHIENLRAIGRELGQPIAILQDLSGPKIRTRSIAGDQTTLHEGATFTLTTRRIEGNNEIVSATYESLPRDCKPGDTILLDDGHIALQVEKTTDTDVVCTVMTAGVLKSNKGINLPNVKISAPALSEKDKTDVAWGLANGVDFVALSFVRRAQDVEELRAIVKAAGSRAQIIAKLEKPIAVGKELEAIIAASDGVMVARGDLGVEMPPEEVPLLQKKIITAANSAGKLVITATQMLESMTENPRPTRAETSDVANAVLDGSDALMLSGESASGSYPLESVEMMARIIEKVEGSADDLWYNYRQMRRSQRDESGDFPLAICEAAAHAAATLGARAVACFTETGTTARMLAKYRPPVPIIAFTPYEETARGLRLAWGVHPIRITSHKTTDEMILQADKDFTASGLVEKGDIIVMTLGAQVALHGSTDLLKLHRIGAIGAAGGRHANPTFNLS